MKLFIDKLTNVDFSYLHSQRGLLGESWFAHLQLSGSLNKEGMVCDFALVKSRVKDWLDTHIDHCLLIPNRLKNLQIKYHHDLTEIHWQYPDGQRFYCKSPHKAIIPIDCDEISEASMATWCQSQLLRLFEESVTDLELSFETQQHSGSFYHYSHGLKKHDGDCQRIAHGHRSPIHILSNGKRNHLLEQLWAEKWTDIYIGSIEDIKREFTDDGEPYFHYAYTARQGNFELILPQKACYNIPTDSTIEWIAAHIHQTLSEQHPYEQITVKAFEGMNKGAIIE